MKLQTCGAWPGRGRERGQGVADRPGSGLLEYKKTRGMGITL